MKFNTKFLLSLINLHQVSLACGLILAISLKYTTWQIIENFSDVIIFDFKNKHEGWDSVVGIVICYKLDSPRFKPWWKEEFLDPSRLTPKPTEPPVQWVPGLFPRGKAARAWCWPPPPSTEVQ
jgi:hypothetical protein